MEHLPVGVADQRMRHWRSHVAVSYTLALVGSLPALFHALPLLEWRVEGGMDGLHLFRRWLRTDADADAAMAGR